MYRMYKMLRCEIGDHLPDTVFRQLRVAATSFACLHRKTQVRCRCAPASTGFPPVPCPHAHSVFILCKRGSLFGDLPLSLCGGLPPPLYWVDPWNNGDYRAYLIDTVVRQLSQAIKSSLPLPT